MPSITVTADVSAFMDGALNFAVITTGEPPTDVQPMIGDASDKSADVRTDVDGRLGFDLFVNAFPGTAWKFTLTKLGATTPQYERAGVTDHNGRGHDAGIVDFGASHA